MNVEQKPVAAGHGQAVAAHGKAKAAGVASGTDAPADGGFVSLLASLGGDDDGEASAEALLPAAADTVSPAGADLPANGGMGPVPGADASADPLAGQPAWLSALQASPGPSPASTPAGAAPLTGSPVAVAARGSDARVNAGLGEGALAGTPAGAEGAVRPAPGAPHAAPPASAGDKGLRIGQDEALRDLPGPLGRAVAEQMQTWAGSQRAQASAGSTGMGADTAVVASARNGDDPRAGGGRLAEIPRAEMSTVALAATEALPQTGALAAPTAAERRAEKIGDSLTRLLGDPAWNQTSAMLGDPADVAAGGGGATAGDLGRQFAEQVSYWVANDVHNAELKLDKFGQSPVEVSISMRGKETRVEFRTDVQEMRQVLQGAVTQLRDLLQEQGLTLAGVSIGGAGADAAGQSGQQAASPRQGVRQALVDVPRAVAAGAAREVAGLSGRALDIFV